VITGIDHPLIGIADMDRARDAYRRIGFVVPSRGSHVEWGTGNWCIMFDDDYLELRGILTDTRPLQGLDRWLDAHGDGMMGVAFGTDNAKASRSVLEKKGIGIRRFSTLNRNFEHADGWTQPEFRLCFPEEDEVYGLGHVVLCEHRTPDLLRPQGSKVHPNSAVRVVGIEGTVQDIDAAERVQKRFLGPNVLSRDRDKIVLSLPRNQTITLHQTQPGEEEGLKAIVLETSDLAATQAFLSSSEISFAASDDQPTLSVSREEACGVTLRFTSA